MATTNIHKHFLKLEKSDGSFQRVSVAEALDLCLKIKLDKGVPPATKIAEQIYQSAPKASEACNVFAECLLELQDLERADTIISEGLLLNPRQPETLRLKAELYTLQNNDRDALKYVKLAINFAPKVVAYYVLAARIFIEKGAFENALSVINKAISVNRQDPSGYYNKAYVLHERLTDKELKLATSLAKQSEETESIALLYFALAKHFELEQDVKSQMDMLHEGNRIKRKLLDAGPALVNEARAESVKQVFSSELVSSLAKSCPSPQLIFIVGFPRSGSTLTEQIIAAHPDVISIGESNTIRGAIYSVEQADAGRVPYPYNIEQCDAEKIDQIRSAFIALLPEVVEGKTIVEKTLANYSMLGLIKILFPDAKIIHTHKNPVDTALGCYKQIFTGSNWHFIYDMDDLRKEYENYHALITYWNQIFTGDIFHLSYEELVSNQETVTRKLLEHCDLSWNDKCLDFSNTNNMIKTASQVQVRKGLYADAVGRWRKYEPYIQPLIPLDKLSKF